MNTRPSGPFNRAVIEDKAGHDFRRTQRMNFKRTWRINCSYKIIELRNQRRTRFYRNDRVGFLLEEAEPAASYMERGAHSIVSIRAGQALNLTIPGQMGKPLQAFPNNRFFMVNLARILDVLPMTATCLLIIRAIRLLSIRRR